MKKSETIVHLLDDLDGSAASETIVFAFDGTTYSIDLNKRNAKALRSELSKWAEHARKAKAPAGRSRRTRGAAKSAAGDSAAIRAWARQSGIEIPARGRIASSVIEQYRNR